MLKLPIDNETARTKRRVAIFCFVLWLLGSLFVCSVKAQTDTDTDSDTEKLNDSGSAPDTDTKKPNDSNVVPDTDTDTDTDTEISAINAAIKWVVTPPERFDESRPYFGTRAYIEPEYRSELSRAFLKASRRFDLPLALLLATGYRESVYRTFLTGPGGEKGIMQVGKFGRRKCKEYCGKVTEVEGGIMCGACWLDKGRQWCKGDLLKGLYAYLGGKCESKHPRTIRAFNKRLKLWAKLAEMIKDKE